MDIWINQDDLEAKAHLPGLVLIYNKYKYDSDALKEL